MGPGSFPSSSASWRVGLLSPSPQSAQGSVTLRVSFQQVPCQLVLLLLPECLHFSGHSLDYLQTYYYFVLRLGHLRPLPPSPTALRSNPNTLYADGLGIASSCLLLPVG